MGSGRDRAPAGCSAAGRLTDVADRIEHAPRAFLLAHEPDELARLAQLVEPAPDGDAVRVAVSPHPDPTRWSIDIACRDRAGLLARLTTALSDHGHEILSATCSTWADDAVVDSFVVRTRAAPGPRHCPGARSRTAEAPPSPAVIDGDVSFQRARISWLTHARSSGPIDEPLLQAASAACALLDIEVHDAHVQLRASTTFDFGCRSATTRQPTERGSASRPDPTTSPRTRVSA